MNNARRILSKGSTLLSVAGFVEKASVSKESRSEFYSGAGNYLLF